MEAGGTLTMVPWWMEAGGDLSTKISPAGGDRLRDGGGAFGGSFASAGGRLATAAFGKGAGMVKAT